MAHNPIPDSTVVATLSDASYVARGDAHGPVWLALRTHDEIVARARLLDALNENERVRLPLFGLPFAVKDNIDVAGLPTTAGCPAFSYIPPESAFVVDALERAGAVCLGKTHLDQFATGLVGTRSPHGALRNPFNPQFVSGGSSSGSAVAVALEQVAFALGTDTAGSGRVPAAFNNLVAIKPTRGLISTRGVVPACRSLDCVSIFAGDFPTAWAVMQAAARPDADDCHSRLVAQSAPFAPSTHAPRLGVPIPLEFFGDTASEAQFTRVQQEWRDLDAHLVAVPFAWFAEAGSLLYDGPWIAERAAAIGAFIDAHPAQCDPIVRDIVAGAHRYSAVDSFRGSYRLRELTARIAPVWRAVDALLVPTSPTFPRLADVAADPIGVNARLGHYCNFVNLLDLAAVTVPVAFRTDGLPGGFTLIAPAGSDQALAQLAHRYLSVYPNRVGVTQRIASAGPLPQPLDDGRPMVRLAVAGAHMRGMPLNHELVEACGRFVRVARTAPCYRLHALSGSIPKPGIVRAQSGAAIALELWDIPADRFGSFVASVPPPLAIGNVEIDDGTWVKGFVCEPLAIANAADITSYGDWRSYVDARRTVAANANAVVV